jgi:prepilin-type N-terminal cleavage/methylation domain-containing protein
MRVIRRGNQRGFTLIDMLFVIALIGLLSSLAIPFLSRARGKAQSTAALGALRVINSAQLTFALTCGLGFYAPDLPALGTPPPSSTDGFLPAEMTTAATVVKSGYSFGLAATPLGGAPASCNGVAAGQTAVGYVAIGDPLDPTLTPLYYGTNAEGILYAHTASLNGLMPESGPPPVGEPIK